MQCKNISDSNKAWFWLWNHYQSRLLQILKKTQCLWKIKKILCHEILALQLSVTMQMTRTGGDVEVLINVVFKSFRVQGCGGLKVDSVWRCWGWFVCILQAWTKHGHGANTVQCSAVQSSSTSRPSRMTDLLTLSWDIPSTLWIKPSQPLVSVFWFFWWWPITQDCRWG